ncbi:Six-hairpin glycosidase-like protein [Aspergillus foveolatus]|uniref:Six-hairpin glycosidase-like protein n=1 Tax=Aspergillus foveolatus TaxID=210207 RepID=UPI003CCD99ED
MSAGTMKSRRLLSLVPLVGVSHALNATSLISQYLGADAPWYTSRIPLFETSVSSIEEVYYYRWSIFRAHQRDLGSLGYISTEFINDVSWQTSPWAILIDAANFHLREGRWCRDRRFKEDYADTLFGPNTYPYQFSEVLADGVWAGYLVDGVVDDAVQRLDAMVSVYEGWSDESATGGVGGYDESKGLYWIQPLDDATEYTISSIDASGGYDGFLGGEAFRPSINAYQFANAKAISNIAALSGNEDLADEYNAKAETIKSLVQQYLWNTTFNHFIDRFYVNNENATYWDPIRGRELVGYVPWTHDLPDDNETYAQAWSHILDSENLAGSHGLRTNEPSYEYYMRQYRYEGSNPECQWNGPSWPYQTTQVLTGLANFLDHYPVSSAAGIISKKEYNSLLTQYANLHYNPSYDGILNLEEDYNADTGVPIVGLARSPHYFHSGFIDQVISGFVGIRPSAEDVLDVNPLADADEVSYFRLENVLYHGHDVSVQWDVDGTRYGSSGLQVEVDGEVVASSDTLSRLSVNITRVDPPAIDRPIAKSIQLGLDTEYPLGNVSVSGVDASDIHFVIDGRVWFYPEIQNWWDTPTGSGKEIWFEIDFGEAVEITRAEIAFAVVEEANVDIPESYRLEYLDGDGWVGLDIDGEYGEAVGNGITDVSWAAVTTQEVRLVFTPKKGVAVRLVELKLF